MLEKVKTAIDKSKNSLYNKIEKIREAADRRPRSVKLYIIERKSEHEKISAIILAIFMLSLTLCAVPAFAAESFDYVKFTASGNDPYVNYTFDTAIDTSKVTWAVVKYRTVTKTDNTGVDLLGQIYVSPAAEPFVPVKWNHSQSWELIVVDLTSVSASTTLASAWTASAGTGFRFDPIESNRDAEAASDSDTAVVSSGDSIDVAFIAFFETEAAAKAFDGTGTRLCRVARTGRSRRRSNDPRSHRKAHRRRIER